MCTINIISLYNFTFFIFLPLRCSNLLEFNSSIIIVEKLLKNRNVHLQFLLQIITRLRYIFITIHKYLRIICYSKMQHTDNFSQFKNDYEFQRTKIYRFTLSTIRFIQIYINLLSTIAFTAIFIPVFKIFPQTYLPVSEATITFHVPRRDHSHRFRTLEVEVQFKGVGPCYWPPNVAGRERICYWNHINIRLVVFGLEHTDIMHHGVGTFQLINNGLVVEENVFQRA